MARKPNTKMIGLFMLLGIVSFIMIIGTFVVQRFSGNKEDMLIMYFEESIKGLNVGSSVLFKGVEIGKVAKIEIIADTSTLSFSIPVFVKINNYQKVISKDGEHQENQRLLNELIEKGLRARLISQSYLTGQLAIELEMFPDTPIILKNNDRFKGVLEIPTILSPMGALSKDLRELPIRQTIANVNDAFIALNRQIPVVMPQIAKTFENINKAVADNARVSTSALVNLSKAADGINRAANSFENLTDYLERHPESLLRGKEKVK